MNPHLFRKIAATELAIRDRLTRHCPESPLRSFFLGDAGGMQLTFRRAKEKLLSLKLDAKGACVLLATLCGLANTAEWDFGEIVSWIDIAPRSGSQRPDTQRIH